MPDHTVGKAALPPEQLFQPCLAGIFYQISQEGDVHDAHGLHPEWAGMRARAAAYPTWAGDPKYHLCQVSVGQTQAPQRYSSPTCCPT